MMGPLTTLCSREVRVAGRAAVYLDLGLLEAGEGGHGHLQVRGQPVQVPGVQLLQGGAGGRR